MQRDLGAGPEEDTGKGELRERLEMYLLIEEIDEQRCWELLHSNQSTINHIAINKKLENASTCELLNRGNKIYLIAVCKETY